MASYGKQGRLPRFIWKTCRRLCAACDGRSMAVVVSETGKVSCAYVIGGRHLQAKPSDDACETERVETDTSHERPIWEGPGHLPTRLLPPALIFRVC